MWERLRENLYPWKGTMPVVEVSGSAHEMGYDYGSQCRPIIRAVCESFIPGLSALVGIDREGLFEEAAKYERAIQQRIGSEYLDEMRGVAEGAHVEYEEVLVLNCSWDLLNSLPTPETHPQYMCSSFIAWGNATKGGHLVYGHNDDGARFIDQFLILLVAKPQHGHAFVSPLVPGYIGYHRTWNSRGCVFLGLALERSCPNDEFEHNVPMWVLQRFLIERCGSVKQAIRTLSEVPPAVPINLLLADREGDGRLLQLTAKHKAELHPTNEVLVCTNHALEDSIKPFLLPLEHPSGTDYRYRTVKSLVEEHYGRIDVDVAKAIQSSHRDASDGTVRPGPNSPCSHYEYVGRFAGTVSTVAAQVSERSIRAHISLGNPCEGRWIEHSLDLE